MLAKILAFFEASKSLRNKNLDRKLEVEAGWDPFFPRKVQYIRELRRLIISVMATLKSVCLERRGLLVVVGAWVDGLLVFGCEVSG